MCRKFQLWLLGRCTSQYYLAAYFTCASVSMSQQKLIALSQCRNNINRSCFAYDVLTNPYVITNATTPTHNLATYRGILLLWQVWSMSEHAKRKHITQTLKPARVSLYMYQTDVLGTILLRTLTTTTLLLALGFFFWNNTRRTPVLIIIICFWNTFQTAMVLYCLKGELTVEGRFVSKRDNKCYCEKTHNCISRLNSISIICLLTKNIYKQLPVGSSRTTFPPPPRTRKTFGATTTRQINLAVKWVHPPMQMLLPAIQMMPSDPRSDVSAPQIDVERPQKRWCCSPKRSMMVRRFQKTFSSVNPNR